MQVLALPREDLKAGYSLTLQAGDWPARDEQVVVTQEGMQLNGWKIGDHILLRDSDLLITGRVQEDAGTSVIWMTYSGGKKLFNIQSGFQIGVLLIDESLDLPTVQTSLEKNPGFPKGYAVYLNHQLYGRYTDMVRDLVRIAYIISALALVVIIFGTMNAASMTLAERKRESAILQTIGFGYRTIGLFLLGRTLLQTMIAFFLAWGIVAVMVKNSLQNPVVFFAKTAILRLTPETVLVGLLLAMLSASLGVWLTTRAHKGLNLADQLRE
jgi:ABC-type antimicrobial peptide transport system permease subunit